MTAKPATAVPPQASPKTSGLAIASLICGIAGLLTCGVGAAVGLVLGIVALVKISHSQGRMGGQGLAIAGVVVSACCAILGAILSAAVGLPLLGLLIILRNEIKEDVVDSWDNAQDDPFEDFFQDMDHPHLPLPRCRPPLSRAIRFVTQAAPRRHVPWSRP